MTLFVFAVVLFAALLHATWNAIVKGGGDKLLTTVLVAAFSGLSALLLLPFVPQPTIQSWPFIAASACCQVVYFSLIARAYHIGDMGQAYPLMRGAAPLLVALVSVGFIGEHLGGIAWAGIGVISAGVLGLALRPKARAAGLGGPPSSVERQAVATALANACVIAAYTLIDGHGVRQSGAPIAYTLWVFLLTGIPLVGWAVLSRRAAFFTYAKGHWQGGLIGGIGTSLSYGLALWAMTKAPVAVVAALRETAIVFGVAISAMILKENIGRRCILAALVIAGGAMLLRLA